MKKILLLMVVFSTSVFAQNPWTPKAPFGGGARAASVGFSIGHYGFIGCGTNVPIWNTAGDKDDFWRWDVNTNTWTQIANYGGGPVELATGFAIEGKGYVCFGWTGAGVTALWEYDTISNVWTQKATFPGSGRYDVSGFVIGHKAYFIAGSTGGPPYLSDVWMYDAHTNTWKQMKNFPESQVESVIAFSIGKHGYAGNGYNNPGCFNTMYEYDTTNDSWTPIAPIPTANGVTENGGTCTIGSCAYVFNGDDCTSPGIQTGWLYDTVTKGWCAFADLGADKVKRAFSVAYVINNHLYMGTGYDTAFHNLGDYVEYTPSTQILVSDTNLCAYDSVHFTTGTSYLASSWNWTFPGGSPASSTLQNPSVYYTATGSYNVKLILSACGGDDTVLRNINVIAGTLGHVTLKGNSLVCAGFADTLIASGGTGYLWSTGDTTSSITAYPSRNILYGVSVSNGGCSKDTNILVKVKPFPPVTLTVQSNDTVCSMAGNIKLFDSPSGGVLGGAAVYSGYFHPDSAILNKFNVFYYSYTDTNGCSATAEDSIYVKTCLGLAELPGDNRIISVYPNPGKGVFTIQWAVGSGQWSVEVYNVLGERVYSQFTIHHSPFTIDLSSNPGGLYFYKLINERQQVSWGKMVIEK